MVWAALTAMNRVPLNSGPGKPCTFQVAKVSGTIRKAEEEAVRQARRLVLAAKTAQYGPSTVERIPSVVTPLSAVARSKNSDDGFVVDMEKSDDDG